MDAARRAKSHLVAHGADRLPCSVAAAGWMYPVACASGQHCGGGREQTVDSEEEEEEEEEELGR